MKTALRRGETSRRARDRALATTALERQEIAGRETARLYELLEQNTRLTEQIERLTTEIHGRVVTNPTG